MVVREGLADSGTGQRLVAEREGAMFAGRIFW